MIAVHLDRVSYTHATEPIFQNISWEIHDNRCVGLIGPNGAGKSTLLGLIAGGLTCDTGSVIRKRGMTVGYLPQHPEFPAGQTLWDVVYSASEKLQQIDLGLSLIEAEMADPSVYSDERKLTRALEKQERLLSEFEEAGGPGYEGRVRSTLRGLGFSDSHMALTMDVLSGGQKKLAGLARLLILQPDLLLLDEPDNHLDLEGKTFLERLIQGYPGGVVIVSHDRFLLDLVVDEIAEMEDGRLAIFPGSYSEYAFEKEMRLLRQQQMFQAQQKQITRLEQAARRLMLWGRIYDNEKFSKRGMNIQKRLDKMERIDRPVLERQRMDLQLSGWIGSSKVLEVTDLNRTFMMSDGSSNTILEGLDLLLMRGERVGLVGPNGAGKSVLFRLILGEDQPSAGTITIGPSVKCAYYAQQHETLEPEKTLIDTVRHAADRMKEGEAVAFLSKFLFTYEQARSAVANLSGGERSRLQMALMMLSGANFLLLDEPTNHLDIASAEVLESALEDFEGTVLVISHDRYFLDRVVHRIVELDQGVLREFAGNYSDYQEKVGY